jgi:hypothetical protein
MNGILTALCGHYYKLKMKLYQHDDRFKAVFDSVLKFDSHTRISELDTILDSCRRAVDASDKMQIAFEKVKETEHRILHLLKCLGVRPRWFMTGEIAGELEYEVWYDDKDNVYIAKVRDLEPEPPKRNVITIKMAPFLDDNYSVIPRNNDDDDLDDDGKAAQDDDILTRQIEAYHEYMKEHGYGSAQ